jgi:hypothetical protein
MVNPSNGSQAAHQAVRAIGREKLTIFEKLLPDAKRQAIILSGTHDPQVALRKCNCAALLVQTLGRAIVALDGHTGEGSLKSISEKTQRELGLDGRTVKMRGAQIYGQLFMHRHALGLEEIVSPEILHAASLFQGLISDIRLNSWDHPRISPEIFEVLVNRVKPHEEILRKVFPDFPVLNVAGDQNLQFKLLQCYFENLIEKRNMAWALKVEQTSSELPMILVVGAEHVFMNQNSLRKGDLPP